MQRGSQRSVPIDTQVTECITQHGTEFMSPRRREVDAVEHRDLRELGPRGHVQQVADPVGLLLGDIGDVGDDREFAGRITAAGAARYGVHEA